MSLKARLLAAEERSDWQRFCRETVETMPEEIRPDARRALASLKTHDQVAAFRETLRISPEWFRVAVLERVRDAIAAHEGVTLQDGQP